MKPKTLSMKTRYGVNLVLTILLWAIFVGMSTFGVISNYWTGILITVGINNNNIRKNKCVVGNRIVC